MLDDGTITPIADDAYRITAADPLLPVVPLNATGLDVEVAGRSGSRRGPRAAGPAQPRGPGGGERPGLDRPPVLPPAPHPDRRRRRDVTRTGYTGDRGYELWMPRRRRHRRCGTALRSGRAATGSSRRASGRSTPRGVEAGLILIEVEYSSSRHAIAPEQSYSPFELGLGRLVDLGKAADFNGRRALLAEHKAGGPARRLVGLELDWAGIEGLFAKHGLAPVVSPLVDRAPSPSTRKTCRSAGRRQHHLGHHDQEDGRASAPWTRRSRSPAPGLSVEYSVEGERGKVAADRGHAAVPRPAAQANLSPRPRRKNATPATGNIAYRLRP